MASSIHELLELATPSTPKTLPYDLCHSKMNLNHGTYLPSSTCVFVRLCSRVFLLVSVHLAIASVSAASVVVSTAPETDDNARVSVS